MKIGVCGGPDNAAIAKSFGYDYIEENLTKVTGMSDVEFSELASFYERLGMPVYSFNCFFPGDIKLYGDDAIETVRRYSERAFERAAALGGSVCVLGSAKSRNLPDGMNKKFAEERFCDVLSVCGELAAKKGLKIAVEPLSRSESNFIHTVAEGAELARRVGLSNVGVLVDFYHFFMNEDTEESLMSANGVLLHAHIARPNADRLMPNEEDVPTLNKWADMLKCLDYKGNMSVEAGYDGDFDGMIKERTKFLQVFRGV